MKQMSHEAPAPGCRRWLQVWPTPRVGRWAGTCGPYLGPASVQVWDRSYSQAESTCGLHSGHT